jgi:hypothetical protein
MKKIRLTESEFHSLIKRMVVEAQKEMGEGKGYDHYRGAEKDDASHIRDLEKDMEYDADHTEEMEEGLGDMVKGVKRFATGYGSKEEKEERMNKFYDELDRIESEFEENPENFFFSDWESKKESLIRQAEENDYLGDIEQIGKADKYVRYRKGRKGLEKMASGYGKSQGSTIYERKSKK